MKAATQKLSEEHFEEIRRRIDQTCKLMGFQDSDIYHEDKRFKNTMCQSHKGNDYWFYDDGSERGKFIIGFTKPDIAFDAKDFQLKIEYEILTELPNALI